MIERGTVVAVAGGRVDVAIAARTDCATCGACAEGAAGTRLLRGAADTLGARVGDTVDVVTPAGARTRAQLLVYVFPVVALLGGYLAGYLLGTLLRIAPDTAGAAVAIVAGALALALLRHASAGFAGTGREVSVRAIIARGPGGECRSEPCRPGKPAE